MASAVDRLLEDLLSSSDEEEDEVAGPKPNGVAPADAPEPHLAAGDRSADTYTSPQCRARHLKKHFYSLHCRCP